MPRLFATLICFTVLAGAARADMGAPGFSRVPHDFVIETESEFPGYRFWLISGDRLEPLDLAPGRPFVITGDGREGYNRNAHILAAPVGLIEGVGQEEFRKLYAKRWSTEADPRLAPVMQSERGIDFLGQVPFYDTRERVIDRCRLEFVPGQHLRVVQVEQNEGSKAAKRAWLAAGVLVPLAIVVGGWWSVQRLRRALCATDTGGRV